MRTVLFFASDRPELAGDLLVLLEFRNCRVPPGQGALRVLHDLHLPEGHLQCVEYHEVPLKRVPDAEEELYRLHGLENAYDASERAEDTCLLAARDEAFRRRFRIEAPVDREAGVRVEDRYLPVEPEHRA